MGIAVHQRRLMAALILLGSAVAHAEEEAPGLPALGAASDQASVVGVSSGGYMASQCGRASRRPMGVRSRGIKPSPEPVHDDTPRAPIAG